MRSVSWIDASGNLWLFGGVGGEIGGQFMLNDLWRFDGTNWTWISGSSSVNNQSGTYGTKGTASASNIPGTRAGPVSWIDAGGNLWLFGGRGYDAAGSFGNLNDLWRFDGTNWTWVSGSSSIRQLGTYGTKGIASASNIPGAREGPVSWIDAGGNLWLFGGLARHLNGFHNDLWRFGN